jgi:hypothetical protein
MLLSVAYCSEYIERLGIVKENCAVIKNPIVKGKRLLNLRKNQTVIISGEVGNYYKIKLNNYSYGYVAKTSIEFKNVLEEDKYKYSLRKLKYNIKHILERFNKKLSSADYFKINGNIPQLLFNSCYIEKQNLVVQLIYSCNKKNKKATVKKTINMENIVQQLIEVIFFKMKEIPEPSYRIEILIGDGKYENLFKDYVDYQYEPSGETYGSLMKLEEEFKKNLKITKKNKDVFKECP